MNNIIRLQQDKCDNTVFLKYIWPRFYELIKYGKRNDILLDMNNVRFISPQVLPKLCCLGAIARKYGRTVELVFNPVSGMRDYLGQMNFFYINKKYHLIYIDEGLTGGEIKKSELNKTFLVFNKEELFQKYSRLYTFDSSVNESDKLKYCIRGEIFGSTNLIEINKYVNEYLDEDSDENSDKYKDKFFVGSPILNVLSKFYSGDSKNKYKDIVVMGLNFVEIIHNSLWYGNANCFLAMQVARYETEQKKKFTRVDVSFSDYGPGMYSSLCEKTWRKNKKTTQFLSLDSFLRLSDVQQQNYYSLLEAILYRKSERVRGLYDVLHSLVGKEANVNIINRNTLVRFDEKRIEWILRGDNTEVRSFWKEDIGFGFSIDISFSI